MYSLPRWTVSIRDFGRIKSADVTLAPLTVLVGRNNTGKSYVASLLWGLLNPERILFPREIPTDDVYKMCDKAIAEAVLTAKEERSSTVLVVDPFVNWLNQLLGLRSSSFLSAVFSYPGLDAGLELLQVAPPHQRVVIKNDPDDNWGSFFGADEFVLNIAVSDLDVDWKRYRVISSIAHMLLTGSPWADIGVNGSIYVPAGRSGLALTLPAVIDKALGKAFGGETAEGPVFPLPLLGFLRLMAARSASVPDGTGEPVARFIEKEIMGGRFERTKPDSTLFQFQPDGGITPMPLHAASSLVSELGPLAEVLSRTQFSTIIIEEPEAHLHLEAQMAMARACARLVSSGVRVVVTTHSDTFLQYLNNLMMLHDHPRREEFMRRWDLSEEDVIDPANALGYEFECPDGSTVVKDMTKGAAGFEPATMNSLLRDLTLMTRDLLADQDDEE
ncbi:MAG: AAA family ATPase [Rhodospirillaceae bacterium]|nr:AAA family ATPase [Rhodospirillales bacterium]